MRCYLSLLFLLSLAATQAQPALIPLRNASLEDEPAMYRVPHGWYYCGFPNESPPDIHPGAWFGVRKPAADGLTYVGLVTRPSGTYETIGQGLAQPLRAGQAYQLQLSAFRSAQFYSYTLQSAVRQNFSHPVRLLLYGGTEACEQSELLAQSPPITDSSWQRLTLTFTPRLDHTHLLISAYYVDPDQQLGGNVMIDHISPIVPIDSVAGRPLLPPQPHLPPAFARPAEVEDWLQREAGPAVNLAIAQPQASLRAFTVRNGPVLQGHPVFYDLVQVAGLQAVGGIDIGIRLRDRLAFRNMEQALRFFFQDLGLPPANIRFRRLSPRRSAKGWQYAEANQEIWLRIR